MVAAQMKAPGRGGSLHPAPIGLDAGGVPVVMDASNAQ
jgi:hypothetical protein